MGYSILYWDESYWVKTKLYSSVARALLSSGTSISLPAFTPDMPCLKYIVPCGSSLAPQAGRDAQAGAGLCLEVQCNGQYDYPPEQLCELVPLGQTGKDWVAVKELNLSYYIGETLLFTIYTQYGNLI